VNIALPLPVTVVLLAALTAAVTDVWSFKVPNAITLPLLLSGLAYHGVTGGAPGLAGSALGALFGFGILIAFYAMGGVGAGDVKLMAAVGAWLGMPLTFYVFLASALATGGYALFLLLLFGKVKEVWVHLQILWQRLTVLGRHLGAHDGVLLEGNRVDRRRLIPFAAMVALGLLCLIVWSRLAGDS
jgi:prepilin peptidase CpaA